MVYFFCCYGAMKIGISVKGSLVVAFASCLLDMLMATFWFILANSDAHYSIEFALGVVLIHWISLF
jgi:hypothetical protein